MKSNNFEIFRVDEAFRNSLNEAATKCGMQKSAYIRFAIKQMNRLIHSHGTGVRLS
jgi:hypothetical protein